MGVSSGLEKYAAWFQSEGTLKNRKVEKMKSGRVSFSISKSRKVEKWAGFILNFEKLKSGNASN